MKRHATKHAWPWLRRFNLVSQSPLITLIVLCLATALMTERFISPLNLTNILVQSSIMAVIAIGMTVGLANGLIIARLGVNPFITTLGTMVLVRGVVYLITGGAPVGDEGLPT